MILPKINLTFDDVLIRPKKSLESRKEADYSIDEKISHPIIPANMDTVSSVKLCEEQLRSGGIAIYHRFSSIDGRLYVFKELKDKGLPIHNLFISIGVSEEERNIALDLYNNSIRNFCIDIAHAHSDAAKETLKLLKKFKDTKVIVGNIATEEAFEFFMILEENGKYIPDYIKVGIGPGSMCTTRIVTGCGVPQLTAILEIVKARDAAHNEGIKYIPIIADGGIKNSGDIVKALGAGADFIMAGNLFAGCEEAPGQIMQWKDGSKWKVYRGSASKDAQVGWRTNIDQAKIVPEGEATLVRAKGKYIDVLHQLLGGLQSGMSYVGAKTLMELRKNTVFLFGTNNAVVENRPHGVST